MADEVSKAIIVIDIQNSPNVVESQRQLTLLKETKKSLEAQSKNLAGNPEEFAKVQTELNKVNSQYKQLTEEIKKTTREQDLNNKTLKEAEGSVNQLRAQQKLLTDEYNRLSKAERENTDQGKKLTAQTKEIAEKIKEASAAIGDNRVNVGNYEEAIKQAIKTGQFENLSLADQRRRVRELSEERETATKERRDQINRENLSLQQSIGQAEGRLDEFGDRIAKGNKEIFNTFSDLGQGITGAFAIAPLFQENTDAAKIQAQALRGLAIAENAKAIAVALSAAKDVPAIVITKAKTLATNTATIAQKGLNAAMKANPIFLVIAGVATLVGGLAFLYNRFEAVRNVIDNMLGPVKFLIDGFKDLASYLFDDKVKESFEARLKAIQKEREVFDQASESRAKILQAEGKSVTLANLERLKRLRELNAQELESYFLLKARKGKLDEDEQKRFDELLKLKNEKYIEQSALIIQLDREQAAERRKQFEKERDERIQQFDFQIRMAKALANDTSNLELSRTRDIIKQNQQEIARLNAIKNRNKEEQEELESLLKEQLKLRNEYSASVIEIDRKRKEEAIKLARETQQTIIDETLEGLTKELEVFDLAFEERAKKMRIAGISEIEIEKTYRRERLIIITDFEAKELAQQQEWAQARKEQLQSEYQENLGFLDDYYSEVNAKRQLQLENENATEHERRESDLQAELEYLEQKKKLNIDYGKSTAEVDAQIAATKRAIRKQDFQDNLDTANAIIEVGNATVSALNAGVDLFVKNQKKAANYKKAIAVFEIAVNTAASIAQIVNNSAQAAEAGGPAAPVLFAAYVLQGISTIAAAIFSATQVFKPEPAAPTIQTGSPSANASATGTGTFAEGGYTGHGGKYQPAGIVHKGEIVWSQKDIAMAGGIAAVESLRPTSNWRGYYDGGLVTSSMQPSDSSTDMARELEAVFRRNPPVVSVEQIVKKMDERVKVTEMATLG